MSIRISLDPKLRIKPADVYDLPKTIVVNRFDESSANQFRNDFEAAINTRQGVIPIIVDSYGGQVYSLMAMLDVIKSSPVPVATICVGKAMSCGSILVSAGTTGLRFMAPSATVLIHDVSGGGSGKVDDLLVSASEAERLNKHIFNVMAKNCGKPADYFLKIMDQKKHANWHLDAKECKKHNLINIIGMPSFHLQIKTELSFELNKSIYTSLKEGACT